MSLQCKHETALREQPGFPVLGSPAATCQCTSREKIPVSPKVVLPGSAPSSGQQVSLLLSIPVAKNNRPLQRKFIFQGQCLRLCSMGKNAW